MFTPPRRSLSTFVFAACLLAPLAGHAQNDNPGDASLALMTLAGDNGRSIDIHFSPTDLVFDVSRAPDRQAPPTALLSIVGQMIGSKDAFVEDRMFNDEVWDDCPVTYRLLTDSAAAKKALDLARVSHIGWVITATSQRYTLFLPDGTPTRATAELRMKEAPRGGKFGCKPAHR